MSTPTPEHILRLGLGFWASRTLLSAVDLGVFSALGDGPADLPTLRVRTGLHERGARDFLDALVALGMLARGDDGRYANTAETGLFLDRAKPSYIGGMLEMASSRLYGHWGLLTEALRTGEPQNERRHRADHFAAVYDDPAHVRRFVTAMSGFSAGPAQAIATQFDWHAYRTFTDVGAAQGMVPVTLARAHKHLSGIGFDLPAVRPVFEEFVQQHGLADRVRFEAGDFFTDALPAADVIVMGHILHDWNLAQKKTLLAKAFAALPPGGAVIVYDAVIDDARRENAMGLLMSLNMLIGTPGGFDYTGADCIGWMTEAGFTHTRVEKLVGPESMVIGIR